MRARVVLVLAHKATVWWETQSESRHADIIGSDWFRLKPSRSFSCVCSSSVRVTPDRQDNRIWNAAAMQTTRTARSGCPSVARASNTGASRSGSESVHSVFIFNTGKTRGPRRATEKSCHTRTQVADGADHRVGDRSTSSNQAWTAGIKLRRAPGLRAVWASGLNKLAIRYYARLVSRFSTMICRYHLALAPTYLSPTPLS